MTQLRSRKETWVKRMARFVGLSSEQRVEAYRDLGLEALEKARATHGRDAALYLNLAIQWIQLADAVASRTRSEAVECQAGRVEKMRNN